MFINEYGSRDDPTVILLAPMMISGSELYGQMSPYFRGSYHILAPDQGGHGKAGAYISADEEYRTLKSFLLKTGCTTIELVYGASMGVAVAYRLFLDPDFTVNHAWFDGVALSSSAGFAEWFVSRMFRKRKKLSAKRRGKPSSMLVSMYGEDFAKRMAKNFERISSEDIDAICHACCHYELRKLTEDEQKKLHLDFGEKDFDWKLSKKNSRADGASPRIPRGPHWGSCGAYPEPGTEITVVGTFDSYKEEVDGYYYIYLVLRNARFV